MLRRIKREIELNVVAAETLLQLSQRGRDLVLVILVGAGHQRDLDDLILSIQDLAETHEIEHLVLEPYVRVENRDLGRILQARQKELLIRDTVLPVSDVYKLFPPDYVVDSLLCRVRERRTWDADGCANSGEGA